MTKTISIGRRCAIWAAAVTICVAVPMTSGSGPMQLAAAMANPTVPVVACPTTYGGSPPTGLPVVPHNLAVALPTKTASQLSYYTNTQRDLVPVLGPRGWACQVAVGGDGTTGLNAYPHGGAPKPSGTGHLGINAASDSDCQGCVYSTVCAFVPGAGKQLGFAGLACTPLKHDETIAWLKGSAKNDKAPVHDVIAFTEPGAIPTDGVVIYDYRSRTGGAASEDTCTLPSTERPLCTAALNDFIKRNWLVPPGN